MIGDILILQKELPLCPKGSVFKGTVDGGYFNSLTDNEAIKGEFKIYKFTKVEMEKIRDDWFDIERNQHFLSNYYVHEVTGKGIIFAISLKENGLELKNLNLEDIILVKGYNNAYIIKSIELSMNSSGHNDKVGLIVKEHNFSE